MTSLDDLNDFLDDSIPDNVLDSQDWEPRLLPDLEHLGNPKNLDYSDIVEDIK